eukprot:5599542-Pleurochrysis_carterae.AAC.1
MCSEQTLHSPSKAGKPRSSAARVNDLVPAALRQVLSAMENEVRARTRATLLSPPLALKQSAPSDGPAQSAQNAGVGMTARAVSAVRLQHTRLLLSGVAAPSHPTRIHVGVTRGSTSVSHAARDVAKACYPVSSSPHTDAGSCGASAQVPQDSSREAIQSASQPDSAAAISPPHFCVAPAPLHSSPTTPFKAPSPNPIWPVSVPCAQLCLSAARIKEAEGHELDEAEKAVLEVRARGAQNIELSCSV